MTYFGDLGIGGCSVWSSNLPGGDGEDEKRKGHMIRRSAVAAHLSSNAVTKLRPRLFFLASTPCAWSMHPAMITNESGDEKRYHTEATVSSSNATNLIKFKS